MQDRTDYLTSYSKNQLIYMKSVQMKFKTKRDTMFLYIVIFLVGALLFAIPFLGYWFLPTPFSSLFILVVVPLLGFVLILAVSLQMLTSIFSNLIFTGTEEYRKGKNLIRKYKEFEKGAPKNVLDKIALIVNKTQTYDY